MTDPDSAHASVVVTCRKTDSDSSWTRRFARPVVLFSICCSGPSFRLPIHFRDGTDPALRGQLPESDGGAR